MTATTFNDRNPNDKIIIDDDENDFQDTEEDDSIDDDEDDDENEVEDPQLHPPKEGSLRLKVRQHVNPLASTYQKPTEFEENWVQNAFAQPNLPTIVDIGCAKGTLCILCTCPVLLSNILTLFLSHTNHHHFRKVLGYSNQDYKILE